MGTTLLAMPRPAVRTPKIVLDADQERLFKKAAKALGLGDNLSAFARLAMTEKVDRMRAEGKKL